MRRKRDIKGFLLGFCLNLIFRGEWFGYAILALIAYYWFGLPIVIFWILIAVWILVSLFITIVFGFASDSGPPPPKKKNKNPYSKKTSDYIDE